MIIALGHLSRTGKDSVAAALNLYYDNGVPAGRALRSYGVHLTGFMWEAKKVAHQLFGWAGVREREYYDANPEKRTEVLPELGTTPLQLWIDLGIKLNEVHPKAFTGRVIDLAKRAAAGSPISPSQVTVVADLRRESEIKAVREAGGMIVKVHRPGAEAKSVTDQQLARYTNWDYILVNDGSMDALVEKAKLLSKLVDHEPDGVLGTTPKFVCPFCHSGDIAVSDLKGVHTCNACTTSWYGPYNREIC